MSAICDVPVQDVVAIGATRWRVLDRTGRVCGLIEAITGPTGFRFRALRFHPPSKGFRLVGEFWNPVEAADCLRHLR